MDEQALVKEISRPLYESKGWMQFLGVVMIIQGVVVALTIIGIIVAWLPIWLGVLLFKSAGSAYDAAYTGNRLQLIQSLRDMKLYFIINGVVMLISVGFIGLVIFHGGMAASMGL